MGTNDSRIPETRTERELWAIRRELIELRRMFDEFAAALLNAKFPYGRPTDRWGRR